MLYNVDGMFCAASRLLCSDGARAFVVYIALELFNKSLRKLRRLFITVFDFFPGPLAPQYLTTEIYMHIKPPQL